MNTRSLEKWHGAGNDFVVDVTTLDGLEFWDAERAAAVCDRHLGVGADGLMVAAIHGDEITSRLFNADGSRAEISGNGIRCLVAAVQRRSGDPRARRSVHTDAGDRSVTVQLDGVDGHGDVDMGTVTLGDPLTDTLGVASVGNPHVVVLDQPEWSNEFREAMAAQFSAHVGGANVEFVTIKDPSHVSITVVERGVGWTLACGTGSVATVAVLHHRGLTTSQVRVDNPGGTLEVVLDGDQARLAGPVHFVAALTWNTP
jgi:diaminopimelate epimerase